MKKVLRNKILCIVLALALIVGLSVSTLAAQAPRGSTGEPMDVSYWMNRGMWRMIYTVPNPGFGTLAGEWTVLTLARAGFEVPGGYFDIYLENIRDMMRTLEDRTDPNDDSQGWVLNPNTGRREVRLGNPVQSTENVRLIIALTALGVDASDFVVDGHSYDLVSVLNNRQNATSMAMYGENQGINGPIWSQIALDSRSWDNPYQPSSRDWVGGTTASHPVTNAVRLQWILDVQLPNGAWDLENPFPGANLSAPGDANMTAMAIQALAPHRDFQGVEAAIEAGMNYLAATQLPNGGWESWGTDNVQSAAQVVVAMVALGMDPVNHPMFVQSTGNPVSTLMRFFDPVTGGFTHAGGDDLMANDQGTYALVAYTRFVSGQPSLYDMRDANPDFLTPHIIPENGQGGGGYLLGDINDDGEVDGRDVIALRRYILELPPVGELNSDRRAFHVAGNSSIDGRDVIALRQLILAQE